VGGKKKEKDPHIHGGRTSKNGRGWKRAKVGFERSESVATAKRFSYKRGNSKRPAIPERTEKRQGEGGKRPSAASGFRAIEAGGNGAVWQRHRRGPRKKGQCMVVREKRKAKLREVIT